MYYVIIICIIENNPVINNSYVSLQYLILPLKISLGTRKNFRNLETIGAHPLIKFRQHWYR